MTSEPKAAAMQIAEEDLGAIIRDEMSEGRSRRFRWDGTINLGHVLTMGAMLATLFMGYTRFDKRLSLVEAQMARQTEVLDRSIRFDEQMRAIKDRLDKIEKR